MLKSGQNSFVVEQMNTFENKDKPNLKVFERNILGKNTTETKNLSPKSGNEHTANVSPRSGGQRD